MFVQILGSAAGGGFPQWNCNCVNCAGFRDGSLRAQARTQSSIALSDDGVNWVLCNASPDIRTQLQGFAPMQPGRALRDTGISAIILMDSQIDHTTGLLSLREGCPHQVWCTDMVHEDLSTGFPLFTMLTHWNGGLDWQRIELDTSFTVPACPNLRFTPLPLRSAAPPYSPHRFDPHPGDNIGLIVEDLRTGGKLFYAPAWARSTRRCWRSWQAAIACWSTARCGMTMKCNGVASAPAPAAKWATWHRTAPAACCKCWSNCPSSARYLSISTTPTRSSTKTRLNGPSWRGAM